MATRVVAEKDADRQEDKHLPVSHFGHRRPIFAGYVTTPTAADSMDGFVCPFTQARLTHFVYAMDVLGSSGTTSVQLNRVRDETDAELLAATLDIANDATDGWNDQDSFQNNYLEKGDLVRVDVDSLATSALGLGWSCELHIVTH